MLAIQSGIAKYHCLYAQGEVASQTPGVFFNSPGICIEHEYKEIVYQEKFQKEKFFVGQT